MLSEWAVGFLDTVVVEEQGAAPTIGNVINLMEVMVKEAGSQKTQPTTINPTEVPEETQPQHSGTTA